MHTSRKSMRLSHHYVVTCLAFFCFVTIFGGCSRNTPAFNGIANRGITTVSSESAFVGANVFLAQEMERSLYLYKFIQSRGAPQAIELTGDSDSSSELVLFYSRPGEYYSAVPGIDPTTKTKEWIIRGPFPITREQYPYISHLDPNRGGVFEIFGKRVIYGTLDSTVPTRIIKPAFVPTPSPTIKPLKKARRKVTTSATTVQKGPAVTVQGTPINLDQEALFKAKQATATSAETPSSGTPQASPQAGSKRPSLDEALQSEINRPLNSVSSK